MPITTYRSKPVVVQGVRYTDTNDTEMENFVRHGNWRPRRGEVSAFVWNSQRFAWIPVHPGDTVVRGPLGDAYPCSPAALAATYDETDSE